MSRNSDTQAKALYHINKEREFRKKILECCSHHEKNIDKHTNIEDWENTPDWEKDLVYVTHHRQNYLMQQIFIPQYLKQLAIDSAYFEWLRFNDPQYFNILLRLMKKFNIFPAKFKDWEEVEITKENVRKYKTK
jgi:hypothetical protein